MTEKNRRTDVILIAVFLAVVAAVALLPSKTPTQDAISKRSSDAQDAPLPQTPLRKSAKQAKPGKESAPLSVSFLHAYLPLVTGASWTYEVRGPIKLVPASRWTMKVVDAPSQNEPGVLEMGFAGKAVRSKVWIKDGGVLLERLPFLEPVEFLENAPRSASGLFLPAGDHVNKGSIWSQEFERDVVYRFEDDKGVAHEETASAREKDRAEIEDLDALSSPAGQFETARISWLSRIEIKVGQRPVLSELTSEPYRKEDMWIAKGVGIVERRIEYAAMPQNLVSFSLYSYFIPGM